MSIVTLYLVEWQGRGFYAKHQSTYEWCFTTSREKAHSYRSEKAAMERAIGSRYGTGHGYRPWRIVKVDGNFNLIEEPSQFRADNPFLKRNVQRGAEITLTSLKGKSA